MGLNWINARTVQRYQRAALAGLLTLAAGAFAVPAVQAQTADNAKLESVREAVKKAFDVEVTRVQPTDYANLYEVQLGGNIVYTNEKAEFVLAGNLVDAKTKRDVTTERIEEISKVDFSTLHWLRQSSWSRGAVRARWPCSRIPTAAIAKNCIRNWRRWITSPCIPFCFPSWHPIL